MIEFMEVLAGEEGSDMRIFGADSGAAENDEISECVDHTVLWLGMYILKI